MERPTQANARPKKLLGPFGRPALRLGRLFGIEIGLDWSWLFIFTLLTFSLSRGYSEEHESWTPVTVWAGALVASLLFFSSILLHELGHSVTSISLGLPVRSITLFVFGGLARLSGEPKSPRDEALIAVAGPAVSVVLGLGFLLAAFLLPEGPVPFEVLGVMCGWLGTINLLLAGFNMVPGFPLDGGRLFRALVWQFTGNYERATLTAAATGSGFAYLLGFAGFLLAFLTGAVLNGLWFGFIAWFLLSAARQSALQVIYERRLSGVPVSKAASPLTPLVSGDATVADLIQDVVLTSGDRTSFVEEDGAPIGMVTLHEVKRVAPEERGRTPLRAIMVPLAELVTIPAEASLWKAMELMGEANIRQLPVERDGRLEGVLTRRRLARILQSVQELERK